MPQLDLFMYTSLLYPFLIFFSVLLIFSQLLFTLLGLRQLLVRKALLNFNVSKPAALKQFCMSLLRAVTFREFVVYYTTSRLLT